MPNVDTLWQRYKSGNDPQARERIITTYAHLAKYVVDRMPVRPSAVIGYDDLLGHAIIGLIDAVEKYDPNRDVKFETYAVTRIRGAVLDALKSIDWVPRSMRAAEQQLKRTFAELEARFGRPATDEELAVAMGVNTDQLNRMLADVAQSAMLSLEQVMLFGEEAPVDSSLSAACDAADPAASAETEERKRLLADAVGELPDRERLVVSLYYNDGLTLKEIAEVLSVTESRVCQLHSKAVIRLHGKLARHEDLLLAVA